jgi:serine/threonine-protein kinase
MSADHSQPTWSASEPHTGVEEVMERFEAAWQQGPAPRLEDFLPTTESVRRAALAPLIGCDLEHRLRLGETVRVENYQQRFPELAQDAAVLLEVVAREYELLRRRPTVTLADYLQRFPQCGTQLRERFGSEDGTADPAPLTSHTTLASLGDAPLPAALPPMRYHPVQFHARGNLGEVLLAQDGELNREVALKRIQERYASDPGSRRRFLREAEITGRLEHPGVVPVYGLGQDAEGRPCYAMRFIQGESLKDAIQRFHAADGLDRDPGEDRLALRQLLGNLVAVCKTMAYAHSRGIIHRDLKPANIMLGKYGETLVVDWGLAKAFERDEPAQPQGEKPLQPGLTTGGETQVGDVMGTPAYFSPEQAAGLWDVVGPASDIFGLGATLYNLLTNHIPYDGSGVLAIMDQAMKGQVIPPRQRKKDVPPALEAICLKAMAHAREDRYRTALDLAADMEHWLADQPVTAYRESAAARLARWTRRHRVLTTSAMAAVTVAALALAIVTVVVGGKNVELASANQREHTAADLAQQTIEDMTSAEALAFLEGQKTLRPQQRRFLERAVAYYSQAVAAQTADASGKARQAAAYFRMGFLQARLGLEKEAETAYGAALERYEVLAAEHPDEASYRQELARSHNYLGALLTTLGQRREAEAEYRAAMAAQVKLAAEQPEKAEYRQDLATSHHNLGALLVDLGQLKDAEREYRSAIAEQTRLTAEDPGQPQYRQALARTHNNLGILLATVGQRPQAEEAYRIAMKEQTRLAKEYPENTQYRQDLSNSHNNLANLLVILERRPEAETEYRAAIAEQARLAVEQPQVPEYRMELAQTHNNLGILLVALSRQPEAEAEYRAAQVEHARLAAEHPQVAQYRQELANSHNNLGVLLAQQGQMPKAEVEFRAAYREQARLVAEQPGVPQYRQQMGNSYTNIGNVLAALGKRREAEVEYRAALKEYERLAAEHADAAAYAIDLGGGYGNLGSLHAEGGDAAEALPWLAKSISTLEGALRRHGRHGTARQFLLNAYGTRAEALGRLKRYREALADWDRVLALEQGPNRSSFRLSRAATRAQAGEPAAATAEAEDVLHADPPNGDLLYAAACVFALAAAQSKEMASAEHLAARAVSILGEAVAKGYKDLKHIQEDNALDALRRRADFKKVLTTIPASK